MSYHLPPLPWLRAFEASARHGTFTAAADELGLTQAAISHQVRSLEGRLGYALFKRLPRSLALTEMGKAYLPSVRKAFDELSAATAGLFGQIGVNDLIVRVPVSFAALWLGPRMKSFHTAYPKIAIRLYSAIWADTLPVDKTDVDIRFGHGNWPGTRSQLIYQDVSIAVSPTSSKARRFADVGKEVLVQVMGIDGSWSELARAAGSNAEPRNVPIMVDTSIAALEMVASGLGHAIVPQAFAQPYLASSRLKQAISGQLPESQAHFFVTPDDRKVMRPEAKLFRDWILAEVAAA